MSRAAIFKDKTAITEKIREAAASVLPIVLIVVLLCFGVLPVGTDVMLSFLTGTLFVILGIGLFSYKLFFYQSFRRARRELLGGGEQIIDLSYQ